MGINGRILAGVASGFVFGALLTYSVMASQLLSGMIEVQKEFRSKPNKYVRYDSYDREEKSE